MSPAIRYVPGHMPVVLDSPHSGVNYPEDFRFNTALALLRQAEDTHVEKLYDFAPGLGVAWVEALFPRSYLDANRHLAELDVSMIAGEWAHPFATEAAFLAKVKLGKGLIWRTTDDGVPIYRRRLSVAEVQARIDNCWHPYHEAVADAIDRAWQKHGYCIHINCHSMPALAGAVATEFPGEAHADFVIGDRDGTTAHVALSRLVCQHLEDRGYSVAYNHPYKGVELVRRYSNSAQNRHSIQIEINRKLYMNELNRELTPGHVLLRQDLRSLVDLLLATDPRAL